MISSCARSFAARLLFCKLRKYIFIWNRSSSWTTAGISLKESEWVPMERSVIATPNCCTALTQRRVWIRSRNVAHVHTGNGRKDISRPHPTSRWTVKRFFFFFVLTKKKVIKMVIKSYSQLKFGSWMLVCVCVATSCSELKKWLLVIPPS